jgi:hypothetical protein
LLIVKLLSNKKQSNINSNKWLIKGVLLKIIGGLVFCLVYIYAYNGGDSWAYFMGAKALGELFSHDFESAWLIFTNQVTGYEANSLFNSETGYPPTYMIRDHHTFTVCRLSSIFYLLGAKSFLVTTLLTSTFSFIGIWKFYNLVTTLYKGHEKTFFLIIICLPSLLFWGSGLMKDTYVLSATCWVTYNFHKIFIERRKILVNILFMILNLLIIINIKSYVILSLLPGMLLWINSAYLKQIKNKFIKVILFPIIISAISFVGFFAFSNINSLMGKYGDVDSAIEQAKIIQKDLLREEQYGTNSYNIGEIDGTIGGMIKLAPLAIFTAIYRPLPNEIGSPLMVISVIENVILIFLTFFVAIRINPISLIRYIINEPFLVFALTFSFIFAFGVGIASTNFGALVRYKIPLMPFFFTALFILRVISKTKLNDKKKS